MQEISEPLIVKQATVKDPALRRLLEPLPGEAALSLETLARRAAPGQPLDTLNACIIILNYLRLDGR